VGIAENPSLLGMDFTPAVSNPINEYFFTPFSPPLSLEESISEIGEEYFLDSILCTQRRLRQEEVTAGYLSDMPFDEPVSVAGYEIPRQAPFQEWMALPLLPPTDQRVEQVIEGPVDSTAAFANITTMVPSPQQTSDSSPGGYTDKTDLYRFRRLNTDGTWSCAYKDCKSPKIFRRDCDFRKHFRYHIKYLSCRYPECDQSGKGSFATRRDRDRHEKKHKPEVRCMWEGCEKVFSREDNMKDHVKRKHLGEFC
jgi:hypothetical protein